MGTVSRTERPAAVTIRRVSELTETILRQVKACGYHVRIDTDHETVSFTATATDGRRYTKAAKLRYTRYGLWTDGRVIHGAPSPPSSTIYARGVWLIGIGAGIAAFSVPKLRE